MIGVHISPWIVGWFEVRRFFFLCGMPALIGIVVAFLFPMAQQASRHSPSFAKIWFLGFLGPALMYTGWMFAVRTIWTGPWYGIGYGLGIALMSRIHAIDLKWPFKIETRRAAEKRLQKGAAL
jgi:hypothetical protein